MRHIPTPHTHTQLQRSAPDLTVHDAWLQLERVMNEAGYVIPHSHSLRKHVTDILKERSRRHARTFSFREGLDVVHNAVARHQYETLMQACSAQEQKLFADFFRDVCNRTIGEPLDNEIILLEARKRSSS